MLPSEGTAPVAGSEPSPGPSPGPSQEPSDGRSHSDELFAALADGGRPEAEQAATRDELVRLHLPLVDHCARRFRNRGEPFEDLVQVGTIGLLKAIDRYDLTRGVEFSSYATPTIIGEIKRHFRDRGWAIRVPRRLQEMRLRIGGATADLAQKLGRSPTARELAEAVGCSVEEIIEGLESGHAYATLSLDAGGEGGDRGDDTATIMDTLGARDAGIEQVELRESVRPLLDGLPEREKRILLLRFFRNMTQAQIAEDIGVSQMHVSRLLGRTLASLRESVREDGAAEG